MFCLLPLVILWTIKFFEETKHVNLKTFINSIVLFAVIAPVFEEFIFGYGIGIFFSDYEHYKLISILLFSVIHLTNLKYIHSWKFVVSQAIYSGYIRWIILNNMNLQQGLYFHMITNLISLCIPLMNSERSIPKPSILFLSSRRRSFTHFKDSSKSQSFTEVNYSLLPENVRKSVEIFDEKGKNNFLTFNRFIPQF